MLNKYLNRIASDFKHGVGFSIGDFNKIEEEVKVGDNVTIRDYVELRKGTVIGDDCYIDSGVSSSGYNLIGNRVRIRYKSILARGVVIEDDVFISPKLMTENLNHKGQEIGGAHIGTGEWDRETAYRVFIGTDVVLASGIEICSGTIIGSKANVRKSITVPGVYVGNPARLVIPKNTKIKIGKNVVIEAGTTIGAQPTIIVDGRPVTPEFGVLIKDGAWIGSDTRVMLGSKRDTVIGKNAVISQLCNIGHDCIIGDKASIMAGVMIGGHAEIGRRTFVGMRATIRNRVKIGKCSFIGQHSNVVKDIPDNVVAWGNPCEVQRERFKTMDYLIRRFLV